MPENAPTPHARALPADGRNGRQRLSPRVLSLVTLLVSLLVTGSFWYQAQLSKREQIRSEFHFQARAKAMQIVRRMKTYEQVLRGAKGLIRGSVVVEPSEFRDYVDTLEIAGNYPGIQGIAIAEIVPSGGLGRHVARMHADGFPAYRVWPEGERPLKTAITRIEPLNIMNQRALGFDMYSEPMRRAAMDESRDSGRAALSGKVKLVQENVGSAQAGVLMYLPVYRESMPAGSVAQRRAAIIGWVYAPFRVGDLIKAIGDERAGDFSMAIFDGPDRAAATCLYGCKEEALQPSAQELASLSTVTIAGRPWLLDMRATPAFVERGASGTSALIAAGGMVTSLLLASLVWVLGSGRQRALMLATDMTSELRASAERTQAERRRLELILSNSYDAFVAFDGTGQVTYWNEQAARTFGWSAAEAAGRDVAELLVPAAQRGAWRDSVLHVAGPGPLHTQRVEAEAQHREGHTIFVEMSVVAVDTGAGPSFNAFVRDLSERREAEQRERENQQSLEQARRALESAQRLESIGMLTGGVAHDFNNVLQIISGNVQLLKHNIGSDRERRLRSIADAVERGARLSSQLLSFARRQQLRPQAVNLPVLLVNIDDLLKRAVGDGVTLGVLAQQGLWDVLANAIQLENVILNLAINARDAMQGRGNFELALANVSLDAPAAAALGEVAPGDYVTVAARDTGSGMPPEVRARAFEPFFTTKAEGLGSGLGLSMAYGFAKQSGGHIEIDSVVGGGTTITIWLPRSPQAAQEVDGDAGRRGVKAGRGETILVVDDDRAVQEMAVEILEDLGYKVLRADDGESALKVLEQAAGIDLLFTDVVMPGPVSSTDLVKMATQHRPGLAVLFTSGYARNLAERSRDLVPGAPLLSKPYPREALAQKVRELLDQHSSAG